MTSLLLILKDFIIQHPQFFKQWLASIKQDVKKNPVKAYFFLAIIGLVMYKYPHIKWLHKNSQFHSSINDKEITKEINLALNECGNGSTITRIAIGDQLYNPENLEKTSSFSFDIVRSCDRYLSRVRKDGSCDLDVSWLNQSWRQIETLDSGTLNLLNSDQLMLGYGENAKQYVFKDGIPIWLKIFNSDHTLSAEGNFVKAVAPKLFDILKSSKRTIDKIGVVKVRHPTYNHIVYLFTLSFWYNESGLPEKKCDNNRSAILRNLARVQRKQLM